MTTISGFTEILALLFFLKSKIFFKVMFTVWLQSRGIVSDHWRTLTLSVIGFKKYIWKPKRIFILSKGTPKPRKANLSPGSRGAVCTGSCSWRRRRRSSGCSGDEKRTEYLTGRRRTAVGEAGSMFLKLKLKVEILKRKSFWVCKRYCKRCK